jgi:hypothetical protein
MAFVIASRESITIGTSNDQSPGLTTSILKRRWDLHGRPYVGMGIASWLHYIPKPRWELRIATRRGHRSFHRDPSIGDQKSLRLRQVFAVMLTRHTDPPPVNGLGAGPQGDGTGACHWRWRMAGDCRGLKIRRRRGPHRGDPLLPYLCLLARDQICRSCLRSRHGITFTIEGVRAGAMV